MFRPLARRPRRLRPRRRRLQCQRQRRPGRAGRSRRRPVATAVAESVPLTRYIPVSGTLAAQEAAEVAAETAGRIVATPVERGSRVGANADLVRISATEVEAQAREAEANAAQIAARLGIAGGAAFDVDPGARGGQRRRQPPPGPHRVRARRDAAQEPAHLAVGVRAEERAARVGRASVRRRRQRRRAAVPVADGGPGADEPGAEGASPTPSCGRRSPAWSASASSRSATT